AAWSDARDAQPGSASSSTTCSAATACGSAAASTSRAIGARTTLLQRSTPHDRLRPRDPQWPDRHRRGRVRLRHRREGRRHRRPRPRFAESAAGKRPPRPPGGRGRPPGGIDGHCHFDQPMSDGSRMADDFRTGTLSAACGGTTSIIPFACQFKGQSLQAAVDDYHRRAEGKAVIDYAFHMIVSDPTERVLNEELPRLIANGYTSFKIYMTYDDLKLNDRQILETLAVARREGAMTMIHAENTDCIAW